MLEATLMVLTYNKPKVESCYSNELLWPDFLHFVEDLAPETPVGRCQMCWQTLNAEKPDLNLDLPGTSRYLLRLDYSIWNTGPLERAFNKLSIIIYLSTNYISPRTRVFKPSDPTETSLSLRYSGFPRLQTTSPTLCHICVPSAAKASGEAKIEVHTFAPKDNAGRQYFRQPVLRDCADTADTSFSANPGSAELDHKDEFDADMDDEASIAGDEEELGEEIKNKENEALFAKSVDNATRALLDGDDLEEILPNPDLVYDAEGESMTMRKRELISGIQPPGNFTGMNQQFALTGRRLLVTEMMMVMEREDFPEVLRSPAGNSSGNFTPIQGMNVVSIPERYANALPFAPSGSRRGTIKGLCGDPAFANDLAYEPAKLFRGGRTDVYRDEAIAEGGIVAPVIIASNKTQLT
ncbi:hypothetical protein GGU11DRAFT_747006 [Lentinula aff. detonsa]|nr:hypothetical protein GGU11DRAFT_747006 [Lentinula aff. detonsa]